MKVVAWTKKPNGTGTTLDTEFKIFPSDDGIQEFVNKKATQGYIVHLFTYDQSFRLDHTVNNFNVK